MLVIIICEPRPPKRGYRFAAEISAVTNADATQPVIKYSLAILPFKLHGFAASDAYLGVGSADILIASLSRMKALAIRPLNAVLPYQSVSVDRLEAGRHLGVDFLLDGSLQQAGSQVRVSLHLLDMGSGEILWSEVFDDQLSNIFALQNTITKQVAEVLLPRLSRQEQQVLVKPFTQNLKAYQSYLTGKHYWGEQTVASMKLGFKCFEQALAHDPNFALAHCGIADYYTILSWDGHVSPHEVLPKARAAALRALALDNGLAQAHMSLGIIQMTYDFEWEGAERSFNQAIELNAAEEMGHFWAVTLRVLRSRFEEVATRVAQAIEASPLSPMIRTLGGIANYYSRQYAKAEAACQEALALIPNYPLAWFMLGLIHTAQGKHEQAVAELDQAATASGRMIRVLSALGYAQARAGNHPAAQAVLAELETRANTEYVQPCHLAIIHAALGQVEQAFVWLEKAYEERHGFLIYLNVEPAFDSIRSDPRFADLLKRMRLAA
jgi:TolB-like protein/Flp pilus assembly protein TadD